jgi:hypothetical protein
MQKLSLFKLVKSRRHEFLEFCGFFNNNEEVVQYLEEIQGMIEKKFQHQLEGEYVVLPSFYYNIQRNPNVKDTNTK